MFDEKSILEKTQGLEPKERAAALAHYIYILTHRRTDQNWQARVPAEWSELSEEARAFNLASAETWASAKEILAAWQEAIHAIEPK
jgi:hypothetical protein